MRCWGLAGLLTGVWLALAVGHDAHAAGGDTATAPWKPVPGIDGGASSAIVFDPVAPDRALEGGGGGQINRSDDGGADWKVQQVGGLDEDFRAIAFDPADHKIVFAASTSEEDGGATAGVYRSNDRGKHWARLGVPVGPTGRPAGYARGLAVDRTGHVLVLADKRQGIFRSTDLGVTWSNPLTQAFLYGLATDPNDAGGLWAGGRDISNGGYGTVWHSTDFGASWTALPVTILDQSKTPVPYGIHVARGTGMLAISYFASDPDTGASEGGAFYSDDHGASWHLSTGLPPDYSAGKDIVNDPARPATLFLGANAEAYPNSLFRSTDGGKSWASVGPATGLGAQFTVAARPAGSGFGSAVLAAGDGILISTDHGQHWRRSDAGQTNAAAYDIASDGQSRHGYYAIDDAGAYHTDNDGRQWQRISTWPGLKVPAALAVNTAGEKTRIYVSTGSALWLSTRAGKDWHDVAPALAAGEQGVYLLTDPKQAKKVYLATSSSAGEQIYVSADAGAHWRHAMIDPLATTHIGPTQLLLDPAAPGVVYAITTDGLFRSADDGQTWTETVAGFADDMAIVPPAGAGKPSTLYLETLVFADDGTPSSSLYSTTDGGTTLTPVAAPFGQDPFRFVAAKGGSGLFAIDLYGGPSVQASTDGAATWHEVAAPLANSFEAAVTLQLIPTDEGLFVTSPVFNADQAFGNIANEMFYARYKDL